MRLRYFLTRLFTTRIEGLLCAVYFAVVCLTVCLVFSLLPLGGWWEILQHRLLNYLNGIRLDKCSSVTTVGY